MSMDFQEFCLKLTYWTNLNVDLIMTQDEKSDITDLNERDTKA